MFDVVNFVSSASTVVDIKKTKKRENILYVQQQQRWLTLIFTFSKCVIRNSQLAWLGFTVKKKNKYKEKRNELLTDKHL